MICKNMPITEHGVEVPCGTMCTDGKRIYCYKHDKMEDNK